MATTSMRMSARMCATMTRVDHVGLAGIAGLALVIFAGEAEGFLERGEIVLGTVLADLGFQFGVQLLDGVGADAVLARARTDWVTRKAR